MRVNDKFFVLFISWIFISNLINYKKNEKNNKKREFFCIWRNFELSYYICYYYKMNNMSKKNHSLSYYCIPQTCKGREIYIYASQWNVKKNFHNKTRKKNFKHSLIRKMKNSGNKKATFHCLNFFSSSWLPCFQTKTIKTQFSFP